MIRFREFRAWLRDRQLRIRNIWWEIFRTTVIVSLCGGSLSELVGIWPAQVLIVALVPVWLAIRIVWTTDKAKQ